MTAAIHINFIVDIETLTIDEHKTVINSRNGAAKTMKQGRNVHGSQSHECDMIHVLTFNIYDFFLPLNFL